MTDQEKREKVINGLEMSYTFSNCDEDNVLVPQRLVLDALALLKAQEPITPTTKDGYTHCGKCGHVLLWIAEKNNYCPNCGMEVKWNG